MKTPTHIEVSAAVRYWEDAEINGVSDELGTLTPLKEGDLWKPRICLATGKVENWPSGVHADIHFKVCDAGQYWLTHEDGKRFAKWNGDYVPDDFLCVNDSGYGDYIIMKIGVDGMIEDWKEPVIDPQEWETI
jgi:hypothetical protein